MGINLLFSGMASHTEDEIKVEEPLTYAVFKYVEAIDSWTWATYPGDKSGDDELDYRSK